MQKTQKTNWNINHNPHKLQTDFLSFLKKNKLQYNVFDIIETAKNLELFLYQNFEISHNLSNCNENLIEIKKNFIQRTVFQKYKNLEIPEYWEDKYTFINQEEFIEEAVNENNLENLEKYCAFAIFTEKGRNKHKNDTIFQIPKSVTQKDNFMKIEGNFVKSYQQNNTRCTFNLTDIPPTKNIIDWNLSYCLYCHNRNKDTCSKGLNSQKQGCPLKQDISESIFLKRHNYHIASLAVIMKENPLCILTGRRICQNCEEACIFQKQEPVDIQSVESQILFDVLNMDFGIEVYNLLLRWNPLNMYNKNELKGKVVLVAGSGPAGLFASYLLSNYGANVLIIDALAIEISEKIKKISMGVIKNAQEFLHQPLSERMPSGIGGVMEYGITVRWNKNLIDILAGLLMRRKNIEIQGSVRLGGFLNYGDVKDFGFNHTAICIGSATPQVPKIEGIFHKYSLTKGVMMASDFLMSLHLNRESPFLDSIANPPVYILGCGLTAIDVANEVRAILLKNKKNPYVKILYYKHVEESSSYKINHFEFKQALNEGVEIIQNVEISKIKKNNYNKICEIVLLSGEVLPCNLLIIAIGTKPNTSHIEQFLEHNISNDDISLFGDCNPKYTGSVVGSLASVKENFPETLLKIKNNNNIAQNYSKIFKRTIAIKEISPDFHKIVIKNQFLAGKAQVGSVLKLQTQFNSSIALTIAQIKDDSTILYIQNSNKEAHKLIDAIIKRKKIHINGINCSILPFIHPDCIIVAVGKTRIILKEMFTNKKIISPDNFIAIDFTSAEFQTNSKIKKMFFIALEQDILENPYIEKKIQEAKNCDIQLFLYQKMNCMLGGICGRCIKPDGTYACIDNTFKLQLK